MEGGPGPGQRVVGPVGVTVILTVFGVTTILLLYLFVALWSPVVPARLTLASDSAVVAGSPSAGTVAEQGTPDTSTAANAPDSVPDAGPGRAAQPASVSADATEAYCQRLAQGEQSDLGCVRVVGRLIPLSTGRRLLYLLFVAGALGSMVHVLRSMGWYVGNRLLTRSWVAYYAVLPFIGGILGVVFYVVIRAGLFAPGATAEAESQFGFVAVAMLVGLFSQQAVLKLKAIADTLFERPPKGADTADTDEDAEGQ